MISGTREHMRGNRVGNNTTTTNNNNSSTSNTSNSSNSDTQEVNSNNKVGKGQMGSALMGSLQISCSLTEGLFGYSR